MKKVFPFLWLLCGLWACSVSAQTVKINTQAQSLPQPETGRIERLENFPSQHVDARHIDVWLPSNFEQLKASGQKFNVIYMHDGQMLFDPQTTWNKQAWYADRAVSQLMATGQMLSLIHISEPTRH